MIAHYKQLLVDYEIENAVNMMIALEVLELEFIHDHNDILAEVAFRLIQNFLEKLLKVNDEKSSTT